MTTKYFYIIEQVKTTDRPLMAIICEVLGMDTPQEPVSYGTICYCAKMLNVSVEDLDAAYAPDGYSSCGAPKPFNQPREALAEYLQYILPIPLVTKEQVIQAIMEMQEFNMDYWPTCIAAAITKIPTSVCTNHKVGIANRAAHLLGTNTGCWLFYRDDWRTPNKDNTKECAIQAVEKYFDSISWEGEK